MFVCLLFSKNLTCRVRKYQNKELVHLRTPGENAIALKLTQLGRRYELFIAFRETDPRN